MTSAVSNPESPYASAAALKLRGLSVRAWAMRRRFSVSTVHAAISGQRAGPISLKILAALKHDITTS